MERSNSSSYLLEDFSGKNDEGSKCTVSLNAAIIENGNVTSSLRDNEYSVAIIGMVTFVGDASRGILFPVLWLLGWLVATFSIGRFLIANPLGSFTDKYRHKLALIGSNVILALGATLWSNSEIFGGLIPLFFAQFIMGLGTGSLGVTRSYVVEQVAPAKRTFMLARLSALQYAGFAATPLLGSAMLAAASTLSPYWAYALPAYLVVALALLDVALLIHPFKDYEVREESVDDEYAAPESTPHNALKEVVPGRIQGGVVDEEQETKARAKAGGDAEGSTILRQTTNDFQEVHLVVKAKAKGEGEGNEDSEASKRDFAMIYALMISLNFTTRGAIAVYETQGSQILLDQYGLSVFNLGLVVTVLGIVGTIQFIFFKQFWTSRFSDITLMIGGCGLMALSQALVINWTSTEITSAVRFIIPQAIMYSFAYPVGNSAVLGIFSKLQKKGRQAKAQGNFALVGSAARIAMPVLSGYFESYVKATSSFALVQVMMALSVVGMIYLQPKIVFYSDGTGDRNSELSSVQWLWIMFFLVVALVGMVGMVQL